MKQLVTIALAATVLSACDSGEGETTAEAPTASTEAALVGQWTGYVENFEFDDGSDSLTISIDSVANGVVTGHVTFGTRAPHPAASDPDVGYPIGYTGDPTSRPLSGFDFAIHEGTFDGQRIRFWVSTNELWSDWCALQTPVADDINPDTYWCLPNWGFTTGTTDCSQPHPVTLEDVPVDCGKLSLCMELPVCSCTAQACAMAEGGRLAFDIEADPGEADGSIDGLSSAPRNIRLSQ